MVFWWPWPWSLLVYGLLISDLDLGPDQQLDQLFILDNADLAAMMILHCCYVLLFILLEDEENVLFTLCKVARGISFLNFNLSLFLQQSDRFLLVFLNIRYKEVSFIFILISKLVRTFHLIPRILQSPDVWFLSFVQNLYLLLL